MKSLLVLARERCREPITVMLLVFSLTIGGGWMLNSIKAADKDMTVAKQDILTERPDIVGYVLAVENNNILVTGQEPRGGETAVMYSFKNVKNNIQVGMQVKVWSLAMEESYPAQAQAEQIKILEDKKPAASPFTRTEAIQKALEKLALGNDLSVTFIKNIVFDEKTLTWNVSIKVKRDFDDKATTTMFELVVNKEGEVAHKNGIREERKEALRQNEHARELNQTEVINIDIALIAEALGKQQQEAALIMHKQAEFSDIVESFQSKLSHVFTGAIHAVNANETPRIFIKGPVTPEVQAIIAQASFDIKIIDKQPYTQAELEALQNQASNELEKMGYNVLSSYFDIEPTSKIQIVVREKESLPTTADEVVKQLPQQFAALLNIQFLAAPTISTEVK